MQHPCRGVLSTSELDAYAKQVLPRLAEVFPQLTSTRRDAVAQPDKLAASDPRLSLQQGTRMQSADVSFPLVPLAEANLVKQ